MRALLIGSGNDIKCRGLQASIDGDKWDAIARVNKHYGDFGDVGLRTDIIFVAKRGWENRFWRNPKFASHPLIVAFNSGLNCLPKYRPFVAKQIEAPTPQVSSGCCAVYWLLSKGYLVDIIGFGFPTEKETKTYCDGTPDNTTKFNWEWEYEWISSQKGVTML